MKQHAIPQDITNYKFHLIGQMTLKQFAEMAVAVVLAFVIYKTNLIGMIKWPLIFFSVGFGAFVAFVPIEDRPMDHWIQTFFKNIYKPTKFFWKKASKIPDFFNFQITNFQADYFAPEVNFNPARKQRVFEYLKSIPSDEQLDNFDLSENQKISRLLGTFDEVEVSPRNIDVGSKQQERPNLKTRVRKLKAPQTYIAQSEHSPNQIFGLVTDHEGHPVTGAIVEIIDHDVTSQRMVKSDRLGNFSISKVLPNGQYRVQTEFGDRKYPDLQIELTGKILNPLVISP